MFYTCVFLNDEDCEGWSLSSSSLVYGPYS